MQRLNDAEMLDYISHGYHLVETAFPREFHDKILAELQAHPEHRGNSLHPGIPGIGDIYNDPKVRGALASILGDDYAMNAHRHCHVIPPGKLTSQSWHQDGTNVRHHQTRTVLGMYYPQDVTAEMGPTAVLPGTHLRNAPTDTMANYTNIKGVKFLTVKAGTVAITHYDLWHAGTLNRSSRPRFMCKFLFDRRSEPRKDAPSWDHNPAVAKSILREKMLGFVGPGQHYSSDLYKEWELRKEMWDWYHGLTGNAAGKFKDILA